MAVHKPKVRYFTGEGRVEQGPGTGTGRAAAAGVPDGAEQVARFAVHRVGYLDALGRLSENAPAIGRDYERLIALYRAMTLTRLFDNKAIALQRTGQLGTYASSLGQEAIGVALGSVMRDEDVLLPAYREYGAQFLRGVAMEEILLYWGGDERGMDYRKAREDFPICVPIATQAPHAVGVAFAFKYRHEARVAVCVAGDGATSKGDFYESLNLAGVWRLPVLFVVNNNGWAISVPRDRQSASETLAQKAIAAGIPGEQVDGNDVIALHARLEAALAAVRAGEGPRLIEALTYRMCDHTTADDASRYRPKQELEEQRRFDPLLRLRRYLQQAGRWDEAQEAQLLEACGGEVESAVKAYLGSSPQPPASMFDHLYAELPAALTEQREAAAGRTCNDD